MQRLNQQQQPSFRRLPNGVSSPKRQSKCNYNTLSHSSLLSAFLTTALFQLQCPFPSSSSIPLTLTSEMKPKIETFYQAQETSSVPSLRSKRRNSRTRLCHQRKKTITRWTDLSVECNKCACGEREGEKPTHPYTGLHRMGPQPPHFSVPFLLLITFSELPPRRSKTWPHEIAFNSHACMPGGVSALQQISNHPPPSALNIVTNRNRPTSRKGNAFSFTLTFSTYHSMTPIYLPVPLSRHLTECPKHTPFS